jgi:hypothetical protein
MRQRLAVLIVLITVGASLTVAGGSLAAPPATSVPADTVTCDLRLNVSDRDPHGLNVRAAPVVAPDNVVGVLKPDGEWTTVHVIGNQGEWFLIDGAETVDDNRDGGMRAIFKGRGWVHRSKLGDIDIYPRDVLEAPRAGAKALMQGMDTQRTAALKVMSCKGEFIELQGGNIKGWASRFCTNERTTCV